LKKLAKIKTFFTDPDGKGLQNKIFEKRIYCKSYFGFYILFSSLRRFDFFLLNLELEDSLDGLLSNN
jgi:hypothetical protein